MKARRARELRVAQTEVEKRLWYRVRNRQLAGCKFRRQAPVGRYIVDFVCFERRLVIELDGGQHAASSEADGIRTSWLRSQGFVIMRFWNNEVIDNIEGVLHSVAAMLDQQAASGTTPHPSPLPQGEREL